MLQLIIGGHRGRACLRNSLAPILVTMSVQPTIRADTPVVIENRSLRVTVVPEQGTVAVLDRRSGVEWRQPARSGRRDREVFTHVHASATAVRFRTRASGTELEFVLTLDRNAPDLVVDTMVSDPRSAFGGAFSLDVLLPPTTDANIAIADYSNGHLYPVTLDSFPATWFAGDRLNMPWVGVCQGVSGPGYMILLETSEDSCIELQKADVQGVSCRLPRVGWLPSKGTFAYSRRMRYRFVKSGGYVQLAKEYRAFAKAAGLLVTLRSKAATNPDVKRLYGAVDVWGDASLTFARAARDAGLERLIIHGRTKPEDMKQINSLGYLTSEYDNYTDILPVEEGKRPDSSHDYLPDAAVLKADGKRMEAWLTYDKKTQYMKRCPSLWTTRADEVITSVLKEYPFLGRFIDVTTAEGLYECYDPKHPLDKRAKRKCGEDLLKLVRNKGLVVGGEHGIWWAVPYLDYIEGMMSSYQFAWPAGHLIRPKSKDEKFAGPYGTTTWENYDRFGIGHVYRVPLWELVFHDCVVSTWYWGDSSDFLLDAAPGYTAKKIAYNILYGTMPLLWASKEGSWVRHRDVFLDVANSVCPVTRHLADQEMVDHRFLTQNRSVQQTRFADGTVCVVNFGNIPYRLRVGRREYVLTTNGFAVYGPRIRHVRHLVNGRETTISESREDRR